MDGPERMKVPLVLLCCLAVASSDTSLHRDLWACVLSKGSATALVFAPPPWNGACGGRPTFSSASGVVFPHAHRRTLRLRGGRIEDLLKGLEDDCRESGISSGGTAEDSRTRCPPLEPRSLPARMRSKDLEGVSTSRGDTGGQIVGPVSDPMVLDTPVRGPGDQKRVAMPFTPLTPIVCDEISLSSDELGGPLGAAMTGKKHVEAGNAEGKIANLDFAHASDDGGMDESVGVDCDDSFEPLVLSSKYARSKTIARFAPEGRPESAQRPRGKGNRARDERPDASWAPPSDNKTSPSKANANQTSPAKSSKKTMSAQTKEPLPRSLQPDSPGAVSPVSKVTGVEPAHVRVMTTSTDKVGRGEDVVPASQGKQNMTSLNMKRAAHAAESGAMSDFEQDHRASKESWQATQGDQAAIPLGEEDAPGKAAAVAERKRKGAALLKAAEEMEKREREAAAAEQGALQGIARAQQLAAAADVKAARDAAITARKAEQQRIRLQQAAKREAAAAQAQAKRDAAAADQVAATAVSPGRGKALLAQNMTTTPQGARVKNRFGYTPSPGALTVPLGFAGRVPEAGSKAQALTRNTAAATTKSGAESAQRFQTPEDVAAIDPPLEPSPFQLGAPTENRFQPPATAAAVEAEASTDASSDEAGRRVETAGAPAWRKVQSSPALYSQTSREVSDMNSELAEMELEAAVHQREARPSRTWTAEAPAGAADALESLRHGGGRARAWVHKEGGAGGRGVTGQVSVPAMEREAEEDLKKMDLDGDGEISFGEFFTAWFSDTRRQLDEMFGPGCVAPRAAVAPALN